MGFGDYSKKLQTRDLWCKVEISGNNISHISEKWDSVTKVLHPYKAKWLPLPLKKGPFRSLLGEL